MIETPFSVTKWNEDQGLHHLLPATLQDLTESLLEVLREPTRKLNFNEAVPWLHHSSTTFFWLLFCYAVLFLLVIATPGPLGQAITQWLDCALVEVGFAHNAIYQFPQIKLFMASIVAMLGMVPLAVTGCIFLPAFNAKFIYVASSGILLPRGPFLSLWFRPLRPWSDFKSVRIQGRPASRWNQLLNTRQRTPFQNRSLC